MNLARTLRHLISTRWGMHRAFNAQVLDVIENAIRETETTHGGEIRVAIENELDFWTLWHDVTPRQRAVEVFGRLGIWDTEQNNGVLIYVLWMDHDVEIVADRAFRSRVGEQEWRDICQRMEQAFAAEQPQTAIVEGVRAVGQLIARHYPAVDRNELPDRPVLL